MDGDRRSRDLLIGILCFGDSASMLRLLSALLIIVGVIGIKVAS